MRSVSVAVQAALAERALVARDFLWIVARDRETGDPVSVGFWSDLSSITAPVKHPDTGESVSRAFYGAAGLIQISDIPAVSNLAVQNVTIEMSQLDEEVAEAVRLYDIKQARVEIYRGLFDPNDRNLVDPAFCRFVGFVDGLQISTPSENSAGSVVLSCASHTQEMLRSNPDTRSDASQRRRNASDAFFVDAAVVGDWDHQWGKASGKVDQKPKGLFGWNNFLGFL